MVANKNEIKRPVVNFPKSIWEGRFKPLVVDEQVYQMQAKEIEGLKQEVRAMLYRIKQNTALEKLNLIDTLQRLGISYHFDKEIDLLLEDIFLQHENSENDLYTKALVFRLLRQHGFDISSGIFHPFLGPDGNFEEALSKDKKALLSLYEAAYTRTRKDDILEKALTFTTTNLKCGQESMSCLLAKQVNHALKQPLHWGTPIVEARHFISVYEEDDEGKNLQLLRLAKLVYSHLQIMYREELDELFSWFDGLETTALKVSHTRDRLVEWYFWSSSVLCEPQYYLGRLIFTKSFAFATFIDDTFDAYGSPAELKAFTGAVERWNVMEIDGLPEYMKAIYVDLINFVEWVDHKLTEQGMSRSHALSNFKEQWKRYVRGNYIQSIWFFKRELPSFEHYKETAIVTTSFFISQLAALMFMGNATKDVFFWLAEDPAIATATATICRFANDIASHEVEKERGATGLECYMKHFKVCEEEAMKKLEGMIENGWKDVNEEFLKEAMPREILKPFLNHARATNVTYKDNIDGFTNPIHNLEPHIATLLLDLIHV